MTIDKEKLKPLIKEFGRYLIVGGTAFLVDFSTLYLLKTYVFAHMGDTGVYLATGIAFIVGLIYNYILSLVWVFKSAKERNKGKTLGAFLIFAIIGVIGLALTEGGMYVGYDLLHIDPMVVKIFVAAVVLIWNYAARKLLIFK